MLKSQTIQSSREPETKKNVRSENISDIHHFLNDLIRTEPPPVQSSFFENQQQKQQSPIGLDNPIQFIRDLVLDKSPSSSSTSTETDEKQPVESYKEVLNDPIFKGILKDISAGKSKSEIIQIFNKTSDDLKTRDLVFPKLGDKKSKKKKRRRKTNIKNLKKAFIKIYNAKMLARIEDFKNVHDDLISIINMTPDIAAQKRMSEKDIQNAKLEQESRSQQKQPESSTKLFVPTRHQVIGTTYKARKVEILTTRITTENNTTTRAQESSLAWRFLSRANDVIGFKTVISTGGHLGIALLTGGGSLAYSLAFNSVIEVASTGIQFIRKDEKFFNKTKQTVFNAETGKYETRETFTRDDEKVKRNLTQDGIQLLMSTGAQLVWSGNPVAFPGAPETCASSSAESWFVGRMLSGKIGSALRSGVTGAAFSQTGIKIHGLIFDQQEIKGTRSQSDTISVMASAAAGGRKPESDPDLLTDFKNLSKTGKVATAISFLGSAGVVAWQLQAGQFPTEAISTALATSGYVLNKTDAGKEVKNSLTNYVISRSVAGGMAAYRAINRSINWSKIDKKVAREAKKKIQRHQITKHIRKQTARTMLRMKKVLDSKAGQRVLNVSKQVGKAAITKLIAQEIKERAFSENPVNIPDALANTMAASSEPGASSDPNIANEIRSAAEQGLGDPESTNVPLSGLTSNLDPLKVGMNAMFSSLMSGSFGDMMPSSDDVTSGPSSVSVDPSTAAGVRLMLDPTKKFDTMPDLRQEMNNQTPLMTPQDIRQTQDVLQSDQDIQSTEEDIEMTEIWMENLDEMSANVPNMDMIDDMNTKENAKNFFLEMDRVQERNDAASDFRKAQNIEAAAKILSGLREEARDQIKEERRLAIDKRNFERKQKFFADLDKAAERNQLRDELKARDRSIRDQIKQQRIDEITKREDALTAQRLEDLERQFDENNFKDTLAASAEDVAKAKMDLTRGLAEDRLRQLNDKLSDLRETRADRVADIVKDNQKMFQASVLKFAEENTQHLKDGQFDNQAVRDFILEDFRKENPFSVLTDDQIKDELNDAINNTPEIKAGLESFGQNVMARHAARVAENLKLKKKFEEYTGETVIQDEALTEAELENIRTLNDYLETDAGKAHQTLAPILGLFRHTGLAYGPALNALFGSTKGSTEALKNAIPADLPGPIMNIVTDRFEKWVRNDIGRLERVTSFVERINKSAPAAAPLLSKAMSSQNGVLKQASDVLLNVGKKAINFKAFQSKSDSLLNYKVLANLGLKAGAYLSEQDEIELGNMMSEITGLEAMMDALSMTADAMTVSALLTGDESMVIKMAVGAGDKVGETLIDLTGEAADAVTVALYATAKASLGPGATGEAILGAMEGMSRATVKEVAGTAQLAREIAAMSMREGISIVSKATASSGGIRNMIRAGVKMGQDIKEAANKMSTEKGTTLGSVLSGIKAVDDFVSVDYKQESFRAVVYGPLKTLAELPARVVGGAGGGELLNQAAVKAMDLADEYVNGPGSGADVLADEMLQSEDVSSYLAK